MFANLLALALTLVLNAPSPERLDDPARSLTRVVPEGRVLFAEVARGEEGSPRLVQDTLGPATRAASVVVLDLETGAVLTSLEPSAVRPVASLTKILTAVTAVRRAPADDIVTVSDHAIAVGRRGANMRLVAGETIAVRDVLAGLLIPSANDAAVALAEHVAGSEGRFTEMMEETARTLGLSRTRAANATGFDANTSFSSAYDVALVLAEAWGDPLLGPLLRAEELDVAATTGWPVHHLRTTNRLLGVRTDILGGKTGLTDAAGENLAVVAESPDGHPVVAVVLGSANRFADMDNLLNWTFWAYRWPAANGNEQ